MTIEGWILVLGGLYCLKELVLLVIFEVLPKWRKPQETGASNIAWIPEEHKKA